MSIPVISDMREPPVVGRFYMVPVVHYRLHGRVTNWPVIGPRHEDAEHLRFPHLHYHLDGRFMSTTNLAWLRVSGRDDETNINGVVLVEPINIQNDEHALALYGRLPARPTLRRMKCRKPHWPFTEVARQKIAAIVGNDAISEHFGPVANAIRRADGRLLCPHRKVDLSTFAPDEEGLVTCPLHGLRVRCTASVDGRRMAETPQSGSVRSTTSAVPSEEKADAQ